MNFKCQNVLQLVEESNGYFDAAGCFDPAGEHGVETQLVDVDEPAFSVTRQQPCPLTPFDFAAAAAYEHMP